MPTPATTTATTTAPQKPAYKDLHQQLSSVLEGIPNDPVALLSTAACLIHQAIPASSWTGFYRVVAPDLLRVGPYQGPLGCLEIPFDRGVCGAAARTRETQLVEDVHAFPGHIACDTDARSEIVVPVDDRNGDLFAVLDLDSHQPAAFDEADREGLEAVAKLLSRYL